MRTREPQFRDRGLIYAGLALVTLAVYLPVLYHGFVDYDDQQYVTENPRVQAGLTWTGLVWAFGFHAGNWHPLAWLSHMLDCQLYGAWAGGHHLTSVLLHVASTLLLFSALHRMTKAPWRSAAVAALFAWHPLHVESVAWVAERKDVLCAFFWMLTLLAYAMHAEIGNRRATSHECCVLREKKPAGDPHLTHHASRITFHVSPFYWLALLCFVLALMSKPMAVTLPFALLLLDYWPLKRFAICDLRFAILQLVWEKNPFFILAAGGCALTLRAQELAIVSTAGLPVSQRIVHALAAYNHYLAAMFVPRDLAVYYPYQIHLPAATVWSAAAALGLVTFLALKNSQRRPYLIVGWLWFLGTLMPVIGLVQVGDQAWADRYTYLPFIGPFMMLVWLAGDFVQSRVILQTAFAIAAAGLLALTATQISYWQSTRTLFEHAEQVTPQNYMALTVLGSLLAKEHKYDEALADYQQALRYQPTFPEAHFFMGAALDEQGKLDEAIAEYQQALWFKPTQAQTHIFLGIALGKQKKYDAAIAHYTAALKLDPDSAVAENNLARIYHTLGRLDEAIAHYHAALAIDQKLALAHNNLGILLIQKGDLARGIGHLREALRLKPGNAETEFNLALALNQQEKWSEAAGLFAKTIGLHSADASAHCEFAVALGHLQKTREAMSEYASALLIQPDFAKALDGLAWILSTDAHADFRNGAEAVKMAERACELTGQENPVKLKTLAAAYAEAGRFADAVKTVQTAKNLAAKAGRAEVADECSQMLEHFQRSESWRDKLAK